MKPKIRLVFDLDPSVAEQFSTEAKKSTIPKAELFRRMLAEWKAEKSDKPRSDGETNNAGQETGTKQEE